VAVICAVDDFLKSCTVIDFNHTHITLCIAYGRFVLFCCIFLSCQSVAIISTVYGVPNGSTSVSDAVFNAVNEFLKCCIRL